MTINKPKPVHVEYEDGQWYAVHYALGRSAAFDSLNDALSAAHDPETFKAFLEPRTR
jgi:hypothetical protein